MNSNIDDALDLNVAAGVRQAIGAQYERAEATSRRFALLQQGKILLPPHPVWEGDFTDWHADPFGDRNWKFQFHTLRWINPLVWAALDGDGESRKEWLRIVKSWYESNLPAKKSATSFAWKDMADGNRAVQLCIGASLPSSEDSWYRELLDAHKDWLLDEENIVSGNHALHQNIGLFVVGAVLRDVEAMKIARARMLQQFKLAFDEEGINEEGSVAYHQLNILWWTRTATRVALENMPFPEYVHERLDAAAEALAHLVLPNGRLPQIGDGVRGSVREGISSHCDYLATAGSHGTAPQHLVREFSNGYYISRSGWGVERKLEDESHLILRHGGRMIGHQHEDRGSVHLYAEGTAWLVDSGFHSYQKKDPIRKYLNSRQAHNVPSLTGLKYDSPDEVSISFAQETEKYHIVEIEDDGFAGNVLRRRVIYLKQPNCWIIQDTNAGDATGSIMQTWHVDAGLVINRHDRGFILRRGDARLVMSWLGRTPHLRLHRAVDDDMRGWIGTKWKTLEPGAVVSAETPAASRGLVGVLAPSRGAKRLGISQSYIATSGVVQVVLVRSGSAWSVTIDSNEIKIVDL